MKFTSVTSRSLLRPPGLTLSAALLALAMAGCGGSININSSTGASLFKRGPKWAPANFVSHEIQTLAIVIAVSAPTGEDYGVTQPLVSNVEQEFTQACLNKGYQLVSRVRIDEWQKELKLQNIGLSDPVGVAKAGKMLNASHLLIITPIVSVQMQRQRNRSTGRTETYYSERGRLDCQIMEIETAQTVAACSDDASNMMAREIQDVVPMTTHVAKRIAAALSARLSSSPTVASDQGVPKTR